MPRKSYALPSHFLWQLQSLQNLERHLSQVPQLAEYFHVDEKELLTLWLADRILDAIEGEKELQFRAIEVAKRELTKADL